MYRRLLGMAAGAVGILACGADGAAGASGSNGKDGAAAAPCTVTQDGMGTTTITCPDGTSAQIHDGEDGAQGPAGPAGPPGHDGADGAGGDDGATLLGGARPPNEADGSDGDFYIDTLNKAIYGPKTNGDWGEPVRMMGSEDHEHHRKHAHG